jgi:hypothetical protein
MSVKDNFNKYYSDLLKELQKTDESLKGGTVYKATPPSFPYIYFKQINGSTALTTLSSTEDGINLGLQIEFYSKTSAANAREIANTARRIMIGFGFSCSYFEPMENTGDTSIFRFMTRFEKLET